MINFCSYPLYIQRGKIEWVILTDQRADTADFPPRKERKEGGTQGGLSIAAESIINRITFYKNSFILELKKPLPR